MDDVGVFFVVCLAFSGWQVVWLVAYASFHESLKSGRSGYRSLTRMGMTRSAMLLALGLLGSGILGATWIGTQGSKSLVVGASCVVVGMTAILCVLVWSAGEASRKQKDCRAAFLVGAVLWLTEGLFSAVIDS